MLEYKRAPIEAPASATAKPSSCQKTSSALPECFRLIGSDLYRSVLSLGDNRRRLSSPSLVSSAASVDNDSQPRREPCPTSPTRSRVILSSLLRRIVQPFYNSGGSHVESAFLRADGEEDIALLPLSAAGVESNSLAEPAEDLIAQSGHPAHWNWRSDKRLRSGKDTMKFG